MKKWDKVAKGVQKELDKRFYGTSSKPGQVRKTRLRSTGIMELISPTGGPFGTRWEFQGGGKIRVEVQSTQVLGAAGFDGSYEAFALSEGGGQVPNLSRRGAGRSINSHVLPLQTYRREFRAVFSSPYGYFWRVKLSERTTSDNQAPLFFRVYRERI